MRMLVIVALLALAAGCTNYDYVVRTDRAPLYRDESRSDVIDRMDRLASGYIAHSAPKGDPVEVEYDGRTGWANRQDLRIFHYDNRDDHERAVATAWNRREVVLEGKDWPEDMKNAIRDGRIQNGMTREMVELSWGRPSATQPLEGGAERWTYEHTRWESWDDVHYDWYPGATHLYYGFGPWGPRWGMGYEFSHYEPHYYRTYYARTDRRSVTFSAAGTVTGWDESRW